MEKSGEFNSKKIENLKENPNMNEKINQWLAFVDDYDREMVKVT